ncbi:hypothetical protein F511_23756 [Dorcoceras hygrometricum]|uniref:Endoplasmic reticulum transmembrane protein n=1 Tax=Dorcoceras hygrometricum TaxID=472368 RepID=A0A2Z7DGM6_9LAMI|nr:hypothetical protein F511_23756 [Dorcoceras hygrometricum]
MIQPLYALVLGEVAVILLLLFRTPLRSPILMILDRMKQGKGPVVASSAGGTLFVILVSILVTINNMMRNQSEDPAVAANPTDQVLFANYLLQATLLGFGLFLALMIDRIHYYIKEIGRLRNHLEAVKRSDPTVEDLKS